MSLLSLLQKRRSVRRFLKKPVPVRVQSRLKEACLRAPSSRDLIPWTFHFVEKQSLLESLSQLKPEGASFLRNAPLAVVISADDSECDTWIEDCSIAAILLQMTALDSGLGSCWVQVHKRRHAEGAKSEDYVRELMGLAPGRRVLCIIAIGYPVKLPQPIPADSLQWDRIWRIPAENSVPPPQHKRRLAAPKGEARST